jgi:hypothetical protein
VKNREKGLEGIVLTYGDLAENVKGLLDAFQVCGWTIVGGHDAEGDGVQRRGWETGPTRPSM